MFGIDDAILGLGLSFGGKLLSGLGAGQSASKANKRAANLQAFADAQNQKLQENVNLANADLGRGLIARSDALPAVDLAAWAAAGDAAGFNRAHWLDAGTLSLFDNRQEKTALLGQGTQLQMPGMTSYGVAQTQAVPSTMSAIGAGVSSLGSGLTDMADNAAKLAQKQDLMSQFLLGVQKARASGNPLAGLGTPSFDIAGPLVSGGGAAAALSLGKKEALNLYGLKDKPGEVFSLGNNPYFANHQDPSLPAAVNIDAAYGWPAGPFYGFGFKAPSDLYWNLSGTYSDTGQGNRSAWSDFPAELSLWNRSTGATLGADRRQAAAAEAYQYGFNNNWDNGLGSFLAWPYSVGGNSDWSIQRLK